ncbi:MAG: hypothetical protein ACYTAN_07715 [Planctomycetota bacterium]|jgi:hypothetical protein
MKARSWTLYVSLALNVALLILVLRPASDDRMVFGQVAASGGNFAAAASQAGSSRDALWLADRVSGTLVVYDYTLGRDEAPLQWVERRNLRDDLELRQLSEIMVVPMNYSSSRSIVCVIDTASERMAVYSYDISNKRINAVQRNDLRIDFGKTQAAAQ